MLIGEFEGALHHSERLDLFALGVLGYRTVDQDRKLRAPIGWRLDEHQQRQLAIGRLREKSKDAPA